MPFEIPRGIWVPEMICLAFCSPESHGISRENMELKLILIGDLAGEMPYEISREIWIQEKILSASCSSSTHRISRGNIKLNDFDWGFGWRNAF